MKPLENAPISPFANENMGCCSATSAEMSCAERDMNFIYRFAIKKRKKAPHLLQNDSFRCNVFIGAFRTL